MIFRRDALLLAATAAAKPVLSQPEASNSLPLPDKSRFRSGDFIWPKVPGGYVPYRVGASRTAEPEAQAWSAERQRFLDQQPRRAPWMSAQDIEALKALDFREFHARYAADQQPGMPGAYASGGGLYVGHVAILDLSPEGEPWVIEALWQRGVVRQTYENWLQARPGEIVWHGRLRDLGAKDARKIPLEARKYIGRPYDFWNFDLLDDTAFYCSKLVWLATMRSLSIAVDGDPAPKRSFWFSPKQLLYATRVARLNDPGPYETR